MNETAKKPLNGKKLALRILLYLVVFIVCVLILYPYFAMLCTSLKGRSEIFAAKGTILPKEAL